MIQNFTYRVPCGDPELAGAVWDKAQILARNKHYLLGGVADHEEGFLSLTLRVSGTDQWKCAAYARQTAKFLLARHGLIKGEPPTPVSVVTEKNLRGLTLDEGRTVRDYPTRSERLQRRSAARSGSS